MIVYSKTKAGVTGEVEQIGEQFVAALFGEDWSVTDLGPHPTSLHAIAVVDAALYEFAEIDAEPTIEEDIHANT